MGFIARIGWKKILCIVGGAAFKIAFELITEDGKIKAFEKGVTKFCETRFEDLNFLNKDSI